MVTLTHVTPHEALYEILDQGRRIETALVPVTARERTAYRNGYKHAVHMAAEAILNLLRTARYDVKWVHRMSLDTQMLDQLNNSVLSIMWASSDEERAAAHEAFAELVDSLIVDVRLEENMREERLERVRSGEVAPETDEERTVLANEIANIEQKRARLSALMGEH